MVWIPAVAAPQTVDATHLLSAEVRDARGRALGEIRDVAVDLEHGLVSYAIFAAREPLAGGERLEAIAFDSLRPALKRNALVLAGPPAPHRPDLDARLMRMTNLLGMPVKGTDGRELGVIADIAVELSTGRLGEVALERSAGADEATDPVAFAALAFPRGSGKAVLAPRPTIGPR